MAIPSAGGLRMTLWTELMPPGRWTFNNWWILLHEYMKSWHQRIKMQHEYKFSAATKASDTRVTFVTTPSSNSKNYQCVMLWQFAFVLKTEIKWISIYCFSSWDFCSCWAHLRAPGFNRCGALANLPYWHWVYCLSLISLAKTWCLTKVIAIC